MATLSHPACQTASKLEFGSDELVAYQQAKDPDEAALAIQHGCSLDRNKVNQVLYTQKGNSLNAPATQTV